MMDKVSNSSAAIISRDLVLNDTRVQERGSLTQQVIGQPEKQADKKISKEQVEKVVDSINQFVQASRTHVSFEFHEKLEDYYVTIVDNETKEVVKEIPPKKLLDAYASMLVFMGILVDQKV